MIESQEHSAVEVGSEKSFGIVFTVVFALIGLYPVIFGNPLRLWSVCISLGLLAITFIKPALLKPLNRVWFKFGMLLAKIVNPLVMFVIYVVAMLPIGITLRIAGKDLLRQRLDKNESSYWITRTPAGPEPESLTDQF